MKQETEWIEWFCFFLLIPSYSGWSRGGTRGGRPPLLLDQTKAQRVEKKIFKTALPPYVSGSGWRPPPAPYLKVWIRHWVNQANWRVGFFVVILSGFCRLLLNRELKQRRRRQQRIRQKSIRFRSEERTTLHVLSHAFVHFSAETSEYNVKLPNFTFHGGREQKTFLFFF